MSNELCSPFKCNVCLMFKAYEEEQNLIANETFQPLLTCSGCQLVQYCNTQHQKLDWPIHIQFCKAVQKIKKNIQVSHPFYISGIPQNKEDIEKTIIRIKYLLRTVLGRSLEYQEEELSSFPIFCGQCFKFRGLKAICKKCNSQAYCSDQHRELHKEKHDAVCQLLQIYYCPYKVQLPKEDIGIQINRRVDDLHKLDLFACIQKVFSLELPVNPCQNKQSYQTFSWAADFSCIMTVCYAIEVLDFKTLDFSTFNIYIMGASIEAILWFREVHCKLFFLQNPHVMELVLDFIGPELVEPSYEELTFSFLGSNRSVRFHTYQGLFQDYCKHYKVRPSLIVAFNCGFSEFTQSCNKSPRITSLNSLETLDSDCGKVTANDTWFEGLVEILQTFDTPIVFTSFTEQESQFDFAALQNVATNQSLKVQIHRMCKAHKNPFSDLRPLRQWYTNDPEEFYYRNGYIQAIRTSLEKCSILPS